MREILYDAYEDESPSIGSVINMTEFEDKKITEVRLNETNKYDILVVTFEDGIKLYIYDDGQSCCESRYVTTDDNIQDMVGHSLVGITIKNHIDGDTHEQIFIDILTTNGSIVLCSHVESNGYYGGFNLKIEKEVPDIKEEKPNE